MTSVQIAERIEQAHRRGDTAQALRLSRQLDQRRKWLSGTTAAILPRAEVQR